MTSRRSRYVRGTDGGNLVLTQRDVEIILACYRHRWLTRAQLQRVVALPHIGRCNDRLRRLFDRGYLERMRAATVGAGLQPIYLAGEAAVPLLVTETGQEAKAIRARLREDGRASEILLPHDLLVNDVRIALVAGLAGHPGVRLDGWLHAAEAFDRYSDAHALRPDGYGRFWFGGCLHTFYLEVDRGTTPLSRWQTKVERYQEYRDGGHYTRRYGLTRFRVLTTAPTPERLTQLLTATAARVARSYWFTLSDTLLADPIPTRPIWTAVGSADARALISPHGGM